MTDSIDVSRMQLALEAARQVAFRGQAPFGACLVLNGQVVATAGNRVHAKCDVTAHAELEVLRSAFARLNTVDLSGAVLYSTCEPCPMCFAASHDAKVSRIVFGTSLEDAERWGFPGFSVKSETLNRYGLRSIDLQAGVSRDQCLDLLQQFSPLEMPARRSTENRASAQVTTLIDEFERQASERPQAVALRYRGNTLTYGELNARANRLAARLREQNVGPGQFVALSVPRSFATLVGILGILKTGAAYVHISPEYPEARRRFLLDDSQARLLITDRVAEVPAGVERLSLPEDGGSDEVDPGNPVRDAHPDDPCYLMYTSGTTGQPNGVIVTHANLARLFPQVRRVFDWSSDDVWSMCHPASFGFSVWEIWGPLAHGGRLLIVPPEVVQAPEELHELIGNEGVTVLSLTPTAFRMFDWADESSRRTVPLRLKYIVFSGEALTPGVVQSWLLRHGDESPRLINTYAATETAGQTAVHRLTCEDLKAPEAMTMGRALDDVSVWLVDEQGNPVPPGVVGELYLGGPAIAPGYWRRPELTKSRFVSTLQHPDAPAGRLYRTGDLAARTADGTLVFHGRADRQVKLQGFRVEPAEVEAVLRTHPAVRDALVTSERDAATGEMQLRAYVVPRSEEVSSAGREAGNPAPPAVEIWPSLGEYQIYDEYLYHVMSAEQQQNTRMTAALERQVAGRVVADLGTGRDALFARLCIAAGARRVYAIEVLESAANDARRLIDRTGLSDRIVVITGDAVGLDLPEPVDVIISRIMGNIGSSDGLIPIYRSARRWLKPGGTFLPSRYLTRVAAVALPDALREQPRFAEASSVYVDRIFEQQGGPFDLRLCLMGVDGDRVLSDSAVFENLDFSGEPPESDRGGATLTIQRSGRCDGFLLWLAVYDGPEELADYLAGQSGWLPVFLPAWDGVAVERGDTLRLEWSRSPSPTPPFPQYEVRGVLTTQRGEFECVVQTGHGTPAAGSTPLFQRLHELRRSPAVATGAVSVPAVRDFLAQRLPGYMRPRMIAFLDAIPLGANGKVDFKALPQAVAVRPDLAVELLPPRDDIESQLVALWEELLQMSGIGVLDEFFELGGSSLIAVQMARRAAEQFGIDIPARAVFEGPTIAELADLIRGAVTAQSSNLDAEAMQQLVAGLSEEEAARLLAELAAGDGSRSTSG